MTCQQTFCRITSFQFFQFQFGPTDAILCAYAEAHGRDIPCAVTPESYALYNKLFWENALLSKQRGFPDTCAMHTEYMEYGLEKGLIELPPDAVPTK